MDGPYTINQGLAGNFSLTQQEYYLQVDNPANFWFYLPQVRRWCPPGTLNYIVNWYAEFSMIVDWDATKDPYGNIQFPQAGSTATVVGLLVPPPSVVPITVSITGTVGLNPNTVVGTTDAGLAASMVKAMSQLLPVISGTLNAAGTLSLGIGAGSTTPYLSGATSWQAIITGGGGGTAGVRLLTSYLDGGGNTILQEQRDTAPITTTIISSGLADTLGMNFALTANSSAHFPMTLTIYQTATILPDQFYDSAIYGPQYSGSGGALVGFDGVLWSVSGWTVAANSNQSFSLPTFKGPVLLGLQSSQQAHGLFQELDYTGAVLRNLNNFPISSSGAVQQNTVFWLPANRNQITLYNDNTTTGNSFYAELRAIKDMVA